jgi:hypothetical protein
MKAWAALVPGGRLVVEPHAPGVIEAMGRAAPTEEEFDTGVFSDRPYRLRIDGEWLPDARVAIQHFTVTELDEERTRVYRSTNQDWPEVGLAALLRDAGFVEAQHCGDWPCNTDVLALWVARKV